MSIAALYFVLFLAPVSAVELRRKADALQVPQPLPPFWPHGRGGTLAGGRSFIKAPFDIEKRLSWTWHGESSRYSNVPNGVNLDGEMNIYLTSLDGIRKFTKEGELLWEWLPNRGPGEEFPDTAALAYGGVYVTSTAGRYFSIDQKTGLKNWGNQLGHTDGTNGWITVDDGMMIFSSKPHLMTGADPMPNPYAKTTDRNKVADQMVTGVNATDGRIRWNFKPEAPLWNFQASIAGDGTFVFQDCEGRAYRNLVSTGERIWTRGGVKGSWSGGAAILGSNAVVYTVNNRVGPDTIAQDGSVIAGRAIEGVGKPGDVVARSLQNGHVIWQVEVPQAPNNIPALGRLFGNKGLSLVQPIGQQGVQGAPTYVYAFNASTGELQWIFDGPVQKNEYQAGDSNTQAVSERKLNKFRNFTHANSWSAPSIDGLGTVFIGSEEGKFYALRDANGDGKVDGDEEVSSYDTSACFSGSASPAIAPGMVVMPSIDQLYVFKAPLDELN